MNKIIKFIRENPILSLVLIAGLWINFLPLPDEKIANNHNPLETTIFNPNNFTLAYHWVIFIF